MSCEPFHLAPGGAPLVGTNVPMSVAKGGTRDETEKMCSVTAFLLIFDC